ncbi:MAG: hypothetical protein J7L04_00525 [Bacteroidales bacterium]|nr:hypothetical protein [Bacteroidales bacterium]
MIDYLIDLSLIHGLVIFIFTTISFSLIIYLTFHYLIKDNLKKSHYNVGRILFRVAAALLSLILSITFANQRVGYFQIKSSMVTEASKMVDIVIDLDLFDTEEGNLIKAKIRNYVLYVSEDGWKSLQEDPFHSRPFILYREIYLDINQLEANTPLQERLKENMLNDIDIVSDYIQVRLYSSREKSSPLIYVSIFGLAGIMILFSVFPPDWLTLGFLCIYTAFIGIILYFILMMGNPLKGPLQLDPGPFLLLKETIEVNAQLEIPK